MGMDKGVRSRQTDGSGRRGYAGRLLPFRESCLRLFTLLCGLACAAAAHAQTQTQTQTVTALCSTDQAWCELAAEEFARATGIRVLQTRKPTGEALAQLRAEQANPKTDLWWGGTGDPFYQAAEWGLLEAYRPD